MLIVNQQKDILQKDVKNLDSMNFFSRWQTILSIFYFEIEYLKGFGTKSESEAEKKGIHRLKKSRRASIQMFSIKEVK